MQQLLEIRQHFPRESAGMRCQRHALVMMMLQRARVALPRCALYGALTVRSEPSLHTYASSGNRGILLRLFKRNFTYKRFRHVTASNAAVAEQIALYTLITSALHQGWVKLPVRAYSTGRHCRVEPLCMQGVHFSRSAR